MARTTKPKKIEIDAVALRRRANLNQKEFWTKLGITQSGGSRYESGRNMPRPVRMLIALSEGHATVEQLRSGELADLV